MTRKLRKPRVLTQCVANQYAAPHERIVEFSFPSTDGPAGGLISFTDREELPPLVQVYRVDGCKVTAPGLIDAMLALQDIERVLAPHPEADNGSMRVHHALMRARSGIAKLESGA